MLRDLLRPSALLRHLLVLSVAVTCVALGQWQLQRLDAVRDNNALLAERLQAPPLDLAGLVADAGVDRDALEFRRVAARGTYRVEEEVLQRGRNHDGQQGFDVLTPLQLEDGGVVLVRRGFVPLQLDTPPVEEATPPTGPTTVEGILEQPVAQPSFGPRDPVEGHLERVFHTDTARLDRQVDGELFPMVLRLQSDAEQPVGSLPVTPPPPVLEENNHLSYAVQWHAFAVLALGTYGAFLFSRHRRQEPGTAPDGADASVESARSPSGTA